MSLVHFQVTTSECVLCIMDQNANYISSASLFNLHINKEIWDDVVEYKEEYAMIVANREMYRILFGDRSLQKHCRAFLIKHLKDAAIAKELTHCTLHLAVYLLDIFMDNHLITPDRLLLVANCVLLIAAKVEECNLQTPRIVELNWLVPIPYPINDYKILEVYMLKHFDWNVIFPTAAHYVHYYLQAAVNKEDVMVKGESIATIVRDMHMTIRMYLDKVLDDVHYMQSHKPSILSAAIISLARQANRMSEWHEQLEHFTRYTLDDLQYTKYTLLQTLPLACADCGIVLIQTVETVETHESVESDHTLLCQ